MMNTRKRIRTVWTLTAVAMAIFTGPAQAGPLKCQLGILTPDTIEGNNPATGAPWAVGDQYRFAFHTSATTTATSADIATYNAWVQGLANASTAYDIGADDGVTWKVIGSTSAVDARDNTSANPTVDGSGHAIFLLDGSTVVANDYADLWDGEIQHVINLTEKGTEWAHWPWTGTKTDGTAATGAGGDGNPLGSTGEVGQGNASVVTDWIWRVWTMDPPGNQMPMYALSDPLVIVVADLTLPEVDAGIDMVTWSGQAVQLDPNVANKDVTPLTYAWGADPAAGVVFDSKTIEAPMVTITKPALTLTALTIVNPGFEDPVLANGSWTITPSAWTNGYYDVTAPTVWVVGNSDAGAYNPATGADYGGVAPEGNNLMFANSGTGYDKGMRQVLSATLRANTQYDLSASVGNPFLFNESTTAGDYRIELLAGGVVLASDTGPSPADDTTWTTASLTYNSGASPAQLGEALEIRLVAVNFTDGKGVDFDDVKLTAEGPTPDPYTVTLTLAVDNEGSGKDDVVDTMTIDVYDDACAAGIDLGLVTLDPADFDGNCITGFEDFAEMAGAWLTDYALTGPAPK
jgi:hypothetical protein